MIKSCFQDKKIILVLLLVISVVNCVNIRLLADNKNDNCDTYGWVDKKGNWYDKQCPTCTYECKTCL